MNFLDRFRSRRARIATIRSEMLGDIAYAQAGRTDAYFSLARQYLELAKLSRSGSPAQGTFIGLAAGALLRYLEAPEAQPFTYAQHTANLVQRVLTAQAAYGRPAYERDPMIALREIGTIWVDKVCDPSGLVVITAAIEP